MQLRSKMDSFLFVGYPPGISDRRELIPKADFEINDNKELIPKTYK